MGHLVPIEELRNELRSLDIKALAKYRAKLQEIGQGFNKMIAPTMMRDFIVAYDIASVLLAKAIHIEGEAKSAVETAEAIAFLDKAPEYFKMKNEKPTVESRKAYVALDPQVIDAKSNHNEAQAAVVLLKNLVQEFRIAGDSVRKLYDDGYMSQWEGMK